MTFLCIYFFLLQKLNTSIEKNKSLLFVYSIHICIIGMSNRLSVKFNQQPTNDHVTLMLEIKYKKIQEGGQLTTNPMKDSLNFFQDNLRPEVL